MEAGLTPAGPTTSAAAQLPPPHLFPRRSRGDAARSASSAIDAKSSWRSGSRLSACRSTTDPEDEPCTRSLAGRARAGDPGIAHRAHGLSTAQSLADPDGNRVMLVPPGAEIGRASCREGVWI